MTSIKRSTMLSLACGAFLALALGSVAIAQHARPGGGSPFRAPLVVAYNSCAVATAEDPAPMSPTNTHVTPLSAPSCAHVPPNTPAQKRSGANPPTLTWSSTGTGRGHVMLEVFCQPGGSSLIPPCGGPGDGHQEDIKISNSSIVGVQCNIAGSGPSGSCAGGPGTAYNGLMLAQSVIRITDHSNAPPPNDVCTVGTGAAPCVTGTVADLTFTVPMNCSAGNCGPVAATINGLLPGAVKDQQRGNVEIHNIRVMSPGNDFNLGPQPFPGTGDEDKFLAQGIFLP